MARKTAGGGRGAKKPESGAGRLVANATLALLLLGVLGAWGWLGLYQLQPGQAAVIVRLGSYVGTESRPGLRWHLPPPLETHDVVKVDAVRREEFGYSAAREAEPSESERLEAAIQTRDNNIVHVNFVVRFRIKDAFESRYRIADPQAVLRDAAQAAVREVAGRTTIDGVIAEQKVEVQVAAQSALQEMLDHYESGLLVDGVELLDVQPPPPVRDAFDDVIAARQDRSRAVNEAEGYANEVLPKARAEAIELRESAQGYKEALVAESRGEASRFSALATEYKREPDVVRTRLYLETMEEILPDVRQVVIEPGSGVLPHFPLSDGTPGGGR